MLRDFLGVAEILRDSAYDIGQMNVAHLVARLTAGEVQPAEKFLFLFGKADKAYAIVEVAYA